METVLSLFYSVIEALLMPASLSVNLSPMFYQPLTSLRNDLCYMH